jgi:hypothetical protein
MEFCFIVTRYSASCYEWPGPIITDLSHSWDDCCVETEYSFPCLQGCPLNHMSRDNSIVHIYTYFHPFVLNAASDFKSLSIW